MISFRFDRLNTLKLSGIRSVLGIDLSRDLARVVELKSLGGIVNKFESKFKAIAWFDVDFPAESSTTERGRILATELENRRIKTRFCVSTVRSSNSRTATAQIPNDVDDVHAWVGENYEKLIRVPVPLKDLAFSVNVNSVGADSARCEIAFVRAAERDDIVELIQCAGLHLLNLGLDVRDSECVFIVDVGNFGEGKRGFIYADETEMVCRTCADGAPGPLKKLHRESLEGELHSLKESLDEIVITGPSANEIQGEAIRVLNPLGLASDYALAAGLAVRGYLPEIGSFDFRPEVVRQKSTEEKDKSLLKSTVLALGTLVLLLLGLQLGVQSYLQGISDKLDAKLSVIGPVYSQVNVLERQVRALRTELSGNDEVQHRSDVAKVPQKVAEATPKGVWLQRLLCTNGAKAGKSLDLTGYAETSEKAASYLGSLQRDPMFSNVQVIRVGVPTQTELASFGSNKMHSFTTFEVRLSCRE